jgi:hypothetical protein
VQTQVEFRSDRFPAFEDEEKLINPGLWGKRLADFLREGLRGQGFETNEPFAEDWGWVVPIIGGTFPLWIGCGRYQEYPDGFLCFIEPHEPFIRKFIRKIDTRERIESLQQAMDFVLAEDAGIRDKRWWSYEEFSNPSRGVATPISKSAAPARSSSQTPKGAGR